MSLVLGKNDSNELSGITLTDTGLLKVDIAGTSTGTQDVDIVGNSVGLATEATLAIVAADTGSIDTKITSGSDFTLAEAQQVLVYGEVTSGPGTGELHPIHITNSGDIEVEIADFKKGQELMVDSFPVVIASDQSVLDTSDLAAQASLSSIDTKLTVGDDDTLVEALQTVVYGRKDASPSGLRALKSDDQGRLMVDIDTDGVGLGTEATLADLNTKVTQGEDDTLVVAQQNLIYGRKDDAPTGLRAMKVNDNGAMYSFDSTLNTKITSGEDDTLPAAQQVLMYGRKDTSPTGLYALKVNSNGALHTCPPAFTYNTLDTLAPGAGGTATSTTINMNTVAKLTFFGSSSNTTDPIVVEVSADDTNWYEASEYFVNTNTVGSLVHYSVNILEPAARYWRVKQTDTTTTAFTLIVNSSKK